MKHLTGEQIVDVAEGTRSEASLPHLAACAACRARLADLRSMTAKLDAVDVPEPSPLFWDHLSKRISEGVAAEGAPRRWSWTRRCSRAAGTIAAWRRPLGPAILVSMAAAAIVLIVALVNSSRTTVPVPVPTVADSAVPREAVVGTAILPPDDPALDIVASLGTELDWDQVHDAGIVAHSGLVDRAVTGLSADERAELGRLLKQELAGGGN